MTTMREWTTFRLAAALLALCAGGAGAEPAMLFDGVEPRAGVSPVSLLRSVREATKDMELPAVVATKEAPAVRQAAVNAAAGKVAGSGAKAAEARNILPGGAKADPAFWGDDGQWCRDGGTYVGGPCDNTGHWRGGGGRDPWARDPSREGRGRGRSPYDDPWYRDPYRRDPYGREPYDDRWERDRYRRDPYREPYRRGPYRRGPSRRYPY